MPRNYITDVIALKKLMVDKRLDKISDLADASGVDRNTVSRIVKGEIQPSSIVMDKIAMALDMEPRQAGEIFFATNLHNT